MYWHISRYGLLAHLVAILRPRLLPQSVRGWKRLRLLLE